MSTSLKIFFSEFFLKILLCKSLSQTQSPKVKLYQISCDGVFELLSALISDRAVTHLSNSIAISQRFST